ncbi:hypothetical protein MTO96_018225 [Rhipicephalus appendiculatus]
MKALLSICIIGLVLSVANAILLKGLALGALGLGAGALLGASLARGGGGGYGHYAPYPMAWHGGYGGGYGGHYSGSYHGSYHGSYGGYGGGFGPGFY